MKEYIKRYGYSLYAMSRPMFLVGIVPLYALGAAAAWHGNRPVQLLNLVIGLLLVWLIQLMTHFNNEYCDLETDHTTEVPTLISGGSRVLVKQLVPRSLAKAAALSSSLLAVIVAVIMVVILQTGLLTLAFAGAAVFLGWFYSAKPLRLEATGAGEMTIVMVSCFLLPLMSFYLQASIIIPGWLIACIPPGLLTLALILTTEIPDYFADKATGKITLVVRLGRSRSIRLSSVLLIAGWLSFGIVIIRIQTFWGLVAAAVSLPLLLFIELIKKSANKKTGIDMKKLELAGLASSLLLGYAGICFTAALLIM